ncbi:MAG: amidohydrolase [Ignavibacteria bacterium]|nr:amidohydrolase [Ignavibacteria bacterium]
MKKLFLFNLIIAFIAIFVFVGCSKNPDVVYYNGKVYTLDDKNTIAEAIAVKDGKIISVGSNKEIKENYSNVKAVDLGGKCVIPGFIDAEGSITHFAENLSTILLEKYNSTEELGKHIKEYCNKFHNDVWIKVYFYGKYESNDDSLGNIDKSVLDEFAPNHNLYVMNREGTIAVLNSKALNTLKLKVDLLPEEIEAGVNENNELDGWITGSVQDFLSKRIYSYSKEVMASLLEIASKEILKWGIVEVRDRNLTKESINIIRNLIDSNKFPIKLYAVISYEYDLLNEFLMKGIEKDYKGKLSVRAVSIDVDGAFEFKLADMFEKYKEAPQLVPAFKTEEDIEDLISKAFKSDFQVNIKAVGDKAVNMSLNSLEKQLKQKSVDNHRTVIENLQFIKADDLRRVKELKVIPSIRPEVCIDDAYILPKLIDSNAIKNLGLWKSLLNNAGYIIVGSDFPFENRTINPLVQIYYLLTRKDIDNPNATQINPSESLSILEALKAYTVWAAYACFDEECRGSLEKNKYADFVVLSEDIFNVRPEDILKIKVLKTIVNGNVMYESK